MAAVQGSRVQVGLPLVVEVGGVNDALLCRGADLPDRPPHGVPSWQGCEREALELACIQGLGCVVVTGI